MAKKKAALQYDRDRYRAIIVKAQKAAADGAFQEAVDLSASALEYVDGMMQFERRFADREFDSLECFHLILRYAPLLFDAEKLDQVGELLKSQRRVEKNTTANLAAELADARALMWDAHRLWNLIEQESVVRQDTLARSLGGGSDRWHGISEAWDRMGVLRRTPEAGSWRISFTTDMDGIARSKCPSCGHIHEATKAVLLTEIVCPRCDVGVRFVLLPSSEIAS